MDEQQGSRWNAGKSEKKENQTESYNFSALCKTKAKTFCLHAATWARSLINPRCSCLWGVTSEGSCPLWPRASVELYWVEDRRDLTALSHKIRWCIYSVALNSKYRAHLFYQVSMAHKMLVFVVPWSLLCKCVNCLRVHERCMPMKMLWGIHYQIDTAPQPTNRGPVKKGW